MGRGRSPVFMAGRAAFSSSHSTITGRAASICGRKGTTLRGAIAILSPILAAGCNDHGVWGR